MTAPLRILHCANFSEQKYGGALYATDRKISNGLIRNGHFVHDFSYRDISRNNALLRRKKLGIGKMNELLLETAHQLLPDLLLLGHSELVSNQTLREFRRLFPKACIGMWWVDALPRFLVNRALFEERIDLVDHFFLTTDPDELPEVLDIRRSPEHLHFMPNICDAAVDTGKAFELEDLLHDVVFIGRKAGPRVEFIDFLTSRLSDVNVGLYGQQKTDFIMGRQYVDLISQSRMGINYSQFNDISLYSSDRQIHLTANGCLALTPETPNMRSLFTEEEVVYFDGLADLEEKIRHYLAHPEEVRRIAAAGHSRAFKDYECATVTAGMLQQMGLRTTAG